MIEKLHSHFIKADDGLGIVGILKPSTTEIVDKLNEIIDVVNNFEVTPDNDSMNVDKIVPVKFIDLCNNCEHMGIRYCEDSHCEIESFCKKSGLERKLCIPDNCPLIYKIKEVKND